MKSGPSRVLEEGRDPAIRRLSWSSDQASSRTETSENSLQLLPALALNLSSLLCATSASSCRASCKSSSSSSSCLLLPQPNSNCSCSAKCLSFLYADYEGGGSKGRGEGVPNPGQPRRADWREARPPHSSNSLQSVTPRNSSTKEATAG